MVKVAFEQILELLVSKFICQSLQFHKKIEHGSADRYTVIRTDWSVKTCCEIFLIGHSMSVHVDAFLGQGELEVHQKPFLEHMMQT